MQIAKKAAVAIDYKLTIDGGFVVDASEKGDPLWYLHGFSNIIPGLEKELDGLKLGDKKTVTVSPEEGYGTYEAERVQQMDARITAMDGKNFTLDFNHELAGKVLTFEIAVAEVRAASKEELAHGHVHGPGGHHH